MSAINVICRAAIDAAVADARAAIDAAAAACRRAARPPQRNTDCHNARRR